MRRPLNCSTGATFESSGAIPEKGASAIHHAIFDVRNPVFIVDLDGEPAVCRNGKAIIFTDHHSGASQHRLVAHTPALVPENLGNMNFKRRYNLKYPYIAGAMAHGISSVELVKAAGKAGMIGFFGSAGLSLKEVEHAVASIQAETSGMPYGFNLVYSGAPDHEMAMVALYLKHGIPLISAAGYLKITLPLLYYRITGIYQAPDHSIICPNRIIAKTSRLEIAKQFLSPPPDKMIRQLVERNLITSQEAALARRVSVASDLTAEADSGGHTDNRSALSLLPSMLDLRDDLADAYQYPERPGIGLGGGIATPRAVSAAFAMGADYVLSGSVSQSCLESGTSPTVKQMLARALQTDVSMAPSANMFERGIKVQVLKRGTLFPQRAARLYEIYREYESIEQLPEKIKNEIQEKIFKNPIDAEWKSTCAFFHAYDPSQLELAEKDPRRRMGLLFRSYLGKSSKWAIAGDPDRIRDYQIWCGPSMGAFNEWAAGSFLEHPENRRFDTVAMNLLLGACVCIRRQQLLQGMAGCDMSLPASVGKFKPLTSDEIHAILKY